MRLSLEKLDTHHGDAVCSARAPRLRYKELYELKLQADPLQRSLPTERLRHTSIHTAMHLRSPVISTIFPTPKERMLRAAELQAALRLMHRGCVYT